MCLQAYSQFLPCIDHRLGKIKQQPFCVPSAEAASDAEIKTPATFGFGFPFTELYCDKTAERQIKPSCHHDFKLIGL